MGFHKASAGSFAVFLNWFSSFAAATTNAIVVVISPNRVVFVATVGIDSCVDFVRLIGFSVVVIGFTADVFDLKFSCVDHNLQ